MYKHFYFKIIVNILHIFYFKASFSIFLFRVEKKKSLFVLFIVCIIYWFISKIKKLHKNVLLTLI